jgi:hypothetical protein
MEIKDDEVGVKKPKLKTPPGKSTIKKATIKDMTELGVYKKEYGKIIDMYVELVYQYNVLTYRFEFSDFKFEESTAQGGSKKAPLVSTLETLRKDIMAYSDRLCLNPKSIDGIKKQRGKKSKLEAAIESMK